jgi:Na+-transporting NADH:ubiquinone oxidoreductase subunit NqrC
VEHAITGADAWRTCFVLMAVCMVAGRVLSTAVVVRRTLRATAVPAAGETRPVPAAA